MRINYYRQLFPQKIILPLQSPEQYQNIPHLYYNDMMILRPQNDEERKLFLFSLGHEYCFPEKYLNQRIMKNRMIIHFIVKGSCYYNKHKLNVGDAFISWPDLPHTLMCIKDDPMEMYWADLTGIELNEYISSLGFLPSKLIFRCPFTKEMHEIFDRALYHTPSDIDIAEYYSGIMQQIMSYCKYAMKRERERSYSKKAKQIEQIKQLLFESQYQLTIENLAHKMNYSRKHISQIFATETNETLVAYRNRKRIELAQSMLQCEQYSVHEISELMGYYDESTFSHTFSKLVGCSPKQYRQNFISFEKSNAQTKADTPSF